MKRLFFLCIAFSFLFGMTMAHADVIDLEELSLDVESYWNGSDASGGFTSQETLFNNNYDITYESWDGFSYSNKTDTSATDWQDSQYIGITGEGFGGSSNYVIGYCSSFAPTPPTVTFPSLCQVEGAYFTNNSYAYNSMLNGDAFSRKFESQDWFLLTITGRDGSGNVTGNVDLLLADGTDIVDAWIWSDLSSLGQIKSLEFTLSSSDTGDWGMNTPAFFCMDHLTFNYPSTKTQGSHDTFIFPGYFGLYPSGSLFTPNYSGSLGSYLNSYLFGIGYGSYALGSYPNSYAPLSGLGNVYSTRIAQSSYLPGVYLSGNSSIGSIQNNPFYGNFLNYSRTGFGMPYQTINPGGLDTGGLFRDYPASFSLNWGSGNYPLVWLSSYGYN